ncbi:MAG: type II toxin-antitoxin system ParD family antitoxin [Alphaproteobacteria bacterium]|nr:type II toxin-antitoxin system ParD family antitoxin [Alphaproteobacteria bacterium]
MQTMNVSLTPELIKIVQSKVESGLYGNASEVVREAIRQMDGLDALAYEAKLERLRKLLEPGLADVAAGRFADYSLDKLKRKLDAKRDAGENRENA